MQGWAHGTHANYGFAISSPNSHTLGFYSWEAPVGANLKPALLIVKGSGAPPEIPIMPAWIAALLVLGVASVLAIRMPGTRDRS